MAFVASVTLVPAGAAATTLPAMVDAGGGKSAMNIHNHARVVAGAGAVSVSFDSSPVRVVIPANGAVDLAVPAGASVINTSAACTLSLGCMK
jgi:hypothetical protein